MRCDDWPLFLRRVAQVCLSDVMTCRLHNGGWSLESTNNKQTEIIAAEKRSSIVYAESFEAWGSRHLVVRLSIYMSVTLHTLPPNPTQLDYKPTSDMTNLM